MDKNKELIEAVHYLDESRVTLYDPVVIEEPLEIVVDGKSYYTTMRLPGGEKELALGHCFSDGIIESLEDVSLVQYCSQEASNRVEISLDQKRKASRGVTIKDKKEVVYSSCGICGTDLIKANNAYLKPRKESFQVTVSMVEAMMQSLQDHQRLFNETGGTHAVGIFDRQYTIIAFAEDIGRHNAFDKVMGSVILERKIEDAVAIMTTSRLSYEMVQKASRSNVEILAGISGATTLGVQLAKNINLTLIGFARKGSGYIYSAPNRIINDKDRIKIRTNLNTPNER